MEPISKTKNLLQKRPALGGLAGIKNLMMGKLNIKKRMLDIAQTAKMASILSSVNKKEKVFQMKLQELRRKKMGSKLEFEEVKQQRDGAKNISIVSD